MSRVVFMRDRGDGRRMKEVVYVDPPEYQGSAFTNAAGLPRPWVRGLPFPWVTPMVEGVPRFREIERVKAELCRTLWGCQVCGDDLDDLAWVALKAPADGSAVVSSAAIHAACLRLAVQYCPVLGDPGMAYVFAEVYRDDVVAVPTEEAEAAGEAPRTPAARWHLRPVESTLRPDRVRVFHTLAEVRNAQGV